MATSDGDTESRPLLAAVATPAVADLEELDRALRRTGLAFAKTHRVIPLRYDLGVLTVATDGPEEKIAAAVRAQSALRDVKVETWSHGVVSQYLQMLDNRHGHEPVLSDAQRAIINALTFTAIKGGSDVFCFPGQTRVEVIGLINNQPRHLAWIDREVYASGVLGTLVPGSMIKQNHDPNKTQTGAYAVSHDGVRIRARVRTYPRTLGTPDGGVEMQAMLNFRLHPDQRDLPDLAGLRLPQHAIDRLRWTVETQRKQAIITGLPGNGKSTSLYAFLRELGRLYPTIYTLESPIEIFIDNLTQREVISVAQAVEERQALLQLKPFLVFIGEALSGEDFGPLVEFLETGVPTVVTYHERTALGALFRAKMIAGVRYVHKVGCVWAQQLIAPACRACSSVSAPSATVLDILRRMGIAAPTTTRKRSHIRNVDCPGCAGARVVGPSLPLVETLIPDAHLRAALRNDDTWEPSELSKRYFDNMNPSIAMQAAHLLVKQAIDEDEFFSAASEEEIAP